MPPSLDQPWTACGFAVLDLETDGPDPSTALPCEIAVARFEAGELVGSWSTLLNPGREMSAEVIGIHGITNELVADAPSYAEAVRLATECGLLEGAWPCGYNALSYDRTILRHIADAGYEPPEPIPFETPPSKAIPWLAVDWIDPLVVVRDIDGLVKGQKGRHKLTAACERRGIVHERAHRAFGDCVATGKLLWAMREEINRRGELTLGELVRRTAARAKVQQADLDRYWGRGKVHGGADVR
jgi:DNA polymerase III epsilon subunit-like protein